MPTVYHWEPNSNSLEVLMALYEKAIPFESRYVDLLAQEMWREPLAKNTEVECNIEIEGPVLVTDKGEALTDSYFINIYLDDAYPQTPLRPADAEGRWRLNVWGRWLGEDFAPAVNTLGCAKYATPKLKDKNIDALPTQERRDAWRAVQQGASEEEIADARRKIALLLTKADEALGKSAYLAGDALTLADLTFYAQANALPKLAPDLLTGAPRTARWLERMRERDSVKKALTHARTPAPDECFAPGAERSRWG